MVSKIIQLEFPFKEQVFEEKSPAQFIYESLKFIMEKQLSIQDHNDRMQKCLFAKLNELEKVNKEFKKISEFLVYSMLDANDAIVSLQKSL